MFRTSRTRDARGWTGLHVGDGWEETEDSGWAPRTLGAWPGQADGGQRWGLVELQVLSFRGGGCWTKTVGMWGDVSRESQR